MFFGNPDIKMISCWLKKTETLALALILPSYLAYFALTGIIFAQTHSSYGNLIFYYHTLKTNLVVKGVKQIPTNYVTNGRVLRQELETTLVINTEGI